MSAEAYAILLALKFVKKKDLIITLICSESLGCLKARAVRYSNNSLVIIIRNELFTLNKQIVLLHTPALCEIRGNEEADGAAKEAVHSNLTTDVHIVKKG
ncbi:hypothetical protein HHI36_003219 [Cryptolaemus montrouzieri]|uniref:RNase H type-1 domain-containing protein n=1 Tax=Cryptolaemus montrouzieri TaxID=559131 RepID=A0ABD2PE99_9CUCU